MSLFAEQEKAAVESGTVDELPWNVRRRKEIILETDAIAKYLWLGRGDQHWYADTEKVIIELFGKEELWLVSQLLAATSIHSTLKSNIHQFKKALHQIKTGQEIKGYLPVVLSQVVQVRDGIGLTGRKINNFAKAMAGDRDAVVVDIWICRAFGQDRKYTRKASGTPLNGGPTENQYSTIEAWIQKNAREMGLQPREFCAMIWSGVRQIATGRNNTTRYEGYLKQVFTKHHKLF